MSLIPRSAFVNGCVLLVFLLVVGCRSNTTTVERAFYYWKSDNYELVHDELTHLKNLQVKKLYVKFFEVQADSIFKAIPIAKSLLRIPNYSINLGYYNHTKEDTAIAMAMTEMQVIPTVFIKNSVFYNMSPENLDSLASNINFLIDKYYKSNINNNSYGYQEMQIDCDWTEKTKTNYFYLLNALKKLSQKKLSCTLRLYPYKYRDKMGVPPVDKITLMCYNLINPLENPNENSIQNNTELEKYLKNAGKYPLHVDIALPVFSWMQVYQNNHFAGMANAGYRDTSGLLKKIKPLWYEVQKDMEMEDFYLREGDKVKLEETTEKATLETIALLKKYVPLDDSTTISLFHLDGYNLKKYTDETLAGFYTVVTK